MAETDDDRVLYGPPNANRPQRPWSEITTEHHLVGMPEREVDADRWKKVAMQAYHELGNTIAFLEAVARGDEDPRRDPDPENVVSMTIAEEMACRRGACLRALEATERTLQAVREFKPRKGEDLELVEVRIKLPEIGG